MSDWVLRHRARLRIVQAIYQHLFSNDDYETLEAQFVTPKSRFDIAYFKENLSEILINKQSLMEKWINFSDYEIDLISPVEQSILYLATHELINREDIPTKVAIDEAIRLTKVLGSEQGYGFVNATLDKVLLSLKPADKTS